MLRKLFIICLLIGSLSNISLSQGSNTQSPANKKGEFYFSWGYNRDWYSKSDIHVKYHNSYNTNNFDFMLLGAKANDKPDMWRWWYPNRLTIPQYDLNLGYFFNDKNDLGIEVGWNHLKYVVTPWQMVHIKGYINGTFYDQSMPLNDTLLHLQHTNGNNYLMLNLVKRKNILTRKKIQLNTIAKAGAGPLISYTIDTALGDHDPGYFHYHGWVAGASLGLRFSFLKYLFIQSDLQGAYANYTNTKLGHEHLGRAYHHFYSLQWTYEVGFRF
jgi:hypothetical protein